MIGTGNKSSHAAHTGIFLFLGAIICMVFNIDLQMEMPGSKAISTTNMNVLKYPKRSMGFYV
jgi:hypothetical protein